MTRINNILAAVLGLICVFDFIPKSFSEGGSAREFFKELDKRAEMEKAKNKKERLEAEAKRPIIQKQVVQQVVHKNVIVQPSAPEPVKPESNYDQLVKEVIELSFKQHNR